MDTPVSGEQERMKILEMIENGKISAEQGLQLLESLLESEAAEESEISEPGAEEPVRMAAPVTDAAPGAEQVSFTEQAAGEAEAPALAENPPEEVITVLPGQAGNPAPEFARKWRNWWMIPLWVGVAITVLSGVLMYQAQQSGSLGFWFFCASVPFLLGLVVIVLAWQSRTAPWLHLRVSEEEPGRKQRIALSFPLPISPTIWFLRIFGDRIPNLKGTSLDEVLLAVGRGASPENPLYIRAEEDDGDQVEIYIG